MRILIVGAGVGGLAAALAIQQRRPDARLILLEQAKAFGEIGAGLQLSPNATRVLRRLGLEQRLAADAFRPQAAEIRDSASGALLFRTALGDAAEARWGAPYWHLHRADLHRALAEAAVGLGGLEVRLEAEVERVEPGDAGRPAAAELSGGERIEADLLIGADGLRSKVRAALFGDSAPRFTGQVAWRATVPVERLPAGAVPPIAAVWTGPGRHLVHYLVRGGALANLVAVTTGEAAPESWREPGDRATLAAAFAGWPEPVPSLIREAPELWRWGLYDRPPMPRWSRGRSTLLGDAAHPMPPFLAQGAAMAIEDADILAACLADSSGRVAAALSAYEAARRPRTARVQAASSRNSRLFHLPGLISRPLFAAAGALDASGGMSRLDWLYGA